MNNIILITGASSDIGLELILNIREECIVLAHYNSNSEGIYEVQKRVSNQVIPIYADFSTEEEVVKLVKTIEIEYGVPNKIIHLAAPKFENIRFKDFDLAHFNKELDISLRSIVIILSNFLPKMAVEKRGRIICLLSSVTLGVPPKALTQYTTIKYALMGLMKSLAAEYGDKKITVNCISPSMIETKFLSLIHDKIVELSANSHPLKRNATVADVLPVIQLLMSDEAGYINGANIPVTGGSLF